MKRTPYQLDPAAWDRSQRHAYDVREFYAVHHAIDVQRHSVRWDRAMYLLAGVFAGLALSTQVFGA